LDAHPLSVNRHQRLDPFAAQEQHILNRAVAARSENEPVLIQPGDVSEGPTPDERRQAFG